MEIQKHRRNEGNTECRLCQQHFRTHCRLRVHLPQHFVTTFCPCGEYSYHRDYVLRQWTMSCFPGHPYDVDNNLYPTFLNLIRPFVTDPAPLARLAQGFPSPQPITLGPAAKPPGYSARSPTTSIRRPKTIPRVLLQHIDTQAYTLPPPLPQADRKRRRSHQSPSHPSPWPVTCGKLKSEPMSSRGKYIVWLPGSKQRLVS